MEGSFGAKSTPFFQIIFNNELNYKGMHYLAPKYNSMEYKNKIAMHSRGLHYDSFFKI